MTVLAFIALQGAPIIGTLLLCRMLTREWPR